MDQIFLKNIRLIFKELTDIYGFRLKTELNEGQYYLIEYSSSEYIIQIEKYFREFYTSLYKTNKPDSKINLFNMLEYVKQGELQIPKSEYFRSEKDIEECYKRQLNHIADVIYENYGLINNFFNKDNYELNIIEFQKYWKNKHPEFYKSV